MRKQIGLSIFAQLASGVLAQVPDPGRAATMTQMQQMMEHMLQTGPEHADCG